MQLKSGISTNKAINIAKKKSPFLLEKIHVQLKSDIYIYTYKHVPKQFKFKQSKQIFTFINLKKEKQ